MLKLHVGRRRTLLHVGPSQIRLTPHARHHLLHTHLQLVHHQELVINHRSLLHGALLEVIKAEAHWVLAHLSVKLGVLSELRALLLHLSDLI